MAETTAPAGDRRKLAVVVTAGVAALAALLWIITGQTGARFTDETRNENNVFQAGSIEITDSQNGVKLFQVPAFLPGQHEEEDITVSNGDNAPLKVKLYTDGVTETSGVDANGDPVPVDSGLAENLDVTISLVTTDENDVETLTTVFEGTLAELGAKQDFANGASSAAGGDTLDATTDQANKSTLVYRIKVGLSPYAGLDEEDVNPNETATVSFIWEGRA